MQGASAGAAAGSPFGPVGALIGGGIGAIGGAITAGGATDLEKERQERINELMRRQEMNALGLEEDERAMLEAQLVDPIRQARALQQREMTAAATAAGVGGGFSSRNQSTGSYSTPVYKTPVRTTKKDNANIALILGIIGFFVSCFLIPIIGLHYVNKAEQYREDRSTIQIAKILNWIQLILMIIGTILGFLYFVGFGFWYY